MQAPLPSRLPLCPRKKRGITSPAPRVRVPHLPSMLADLQAPCPHVGLQLMHQVETWVLSPPEPRVMPLSHLVVLASEDVQRRRPAAVHSSSPRIVVKPRVAHLQRRPFTRPQARQRGRATTSASPSRSSARVCVLDRSTATTMSRLTGYFMERCVPANRPMHLASRPYPPAAMIGDSLR